MKKLRAIQVVEFFHPMQYPTKTHHDKDLVTTCKKGTKKVDNQTQVRMIDSPGLKDARAKISAALGSREEKPSKPFSGPIKLDIVFYFPLKGKHFDGEAHINKPDRDNLEKTFMDCLAETGYIKNDSMVFTGNVSKIWSSEPGFHMEMTLFEYVEVDS